MAARSCAGIAGRLPRNASSGVSWAASGAATNSVARARRAIAGIVLVPEKVEHGIDRQADQPAPHRPLDADELQVAAAPQFEHPRPVLRVPDAHALAVE